MKKDRLIALTDAVLAIIMTILILELEKPATPSLRISSEVVWANLYLLFFVSFMPYATGLVSSHFENYTAQLFYGSVVIVSTIINWYLHKVLDKPNQDQVELLKETEAYRKLLIPDILIKCVGFILALIIYPPIMMYSVLAAAAYIIPLKTIKEKKK